MILSLENAAGVKGHAACPVRVRFAENNPCWVMAASPEVIDNHNGIWKDEFRDWIGALFAAHIAKSPMLISKSER